MERYQELEHTADWAFRAFGRDLVELYQNAAYALFALEGALDTPSTTTHTVRVEGIDRESLLVNWLSELLYLQETRRETFQKFEINELSDTSLTATIHGAPAPPNIKPIKAITYHDLKIEQTPDGWQATIVVDV